MVKTPKVRHSRPHREPVTIELGPDDVSRVAGGPANVGPEASGERANAGPEVAGAAEQPNREAAAEQASAASSAAEEPVPVADEHAAPRRAFSYGFDEQPPREDVRERPSTGDDEAPQAASPNAPPHDPAPAPEPAARGSGLGGRIAAGVISGVIALAGAGLLQYAGLLGAPGGGAAAVSLDGVNGQIADLRGEITALKNAGDGGIGTRVDGLSAALDQVKADLLSLKSEVESGGGDSAGLAALSDRVAGIEKSVAALARQGGGQPADIGPVNEKLAALEALVRQAGDAAGAQQDRIAALEQSVSQLSARVDAQASQPKIALAIASAALKSALERGAPFSAELDTFTAIAPDAPQIAALRAYAQKGVPARADIAAAVDDAANRMIAAAQPADPNAGFFERLLSSAQSLVKVRPIGAVEGKGVPETVARMEAAVNQGDYARALAEYDSLPEAAKAAGADFAAMLRARLDAEAQLDALISGAMKA